MEDHQDDIVHYSHCHFDEDSTTRCTVLLGCQGGSHMGAPLSVHAEHTRSLEDYPEDSVLQAMLHKISNLIGQKV